MYVVEYKKKKVVDYLNTLKKGKVLFMFHHGLGDAVNFLPLFNAVAKQYPKLTFFINFGKSGYDVITPYSFDMDLNQFRQIMNQFDYVFRIDYQDPTGKYLYVAKPYMCNATEIGLSEFEWKQIVLGDGPAKEKRVGVHFFGNTNPGKKNISESAAEEIWTAIEDFGYEPFEIHNGKYNDNNFGRKFLKAGQTIRFDNPTLEDFMREISKCRFFIGIESGPLYLAGTIIGYENCIGLQVVKKFWSYVPVDFPVIDISDLDTMEIKKKLGEILNGGRKRKRSLSSSHGNDGKRKTVRGTKNQGGKI